ncbi:MAG TPA: glutamine amidotransferase [Streptosporangiaceae bacterium]|jgi:hypothetical protein
MSSSSLRLVWIYPDLLSTYGDQGNLLILERRARLRGIETESVLVRSDEPVPDSGDIYLMGGGEDRPQILAAQRLRGDGGLPRAAASGAVVLAVCAGFQIIGTEFGDDQGRPMAGLGLLDIRSGRGERRAVGEVIADVDSRLGLPPLSGFENHQGATTIGQGALPLAKVTVGIGNGDGQGYEGAYRDRVIGTYLHGPALVRNPALADHLLGLATGGALPTIDDTYAGLLRDERLHAVRAAAK